MIEQIIKIAIDAGKAIMEVYHSADFGVEMKTDNSPLTLADKASDEIIKAALTETFPDIPILSEEGRDIPYKERKDWEKFWLVDPLDGTKEFIKKNDEFTVNIALIKNNIPVLGVIYAPALENKNTEVRIRKPGEGTFNRIEIPFGTLYYGQKKSGAFRQVSGSEPEKISVNKDKSRGIIAVRSRSHAAPEEEIIYKKYGVTKTIPGGSSLKFCKVADGSAHIYYRYGPTMEWDVGAGYAIAESAGAVIEGIVFNKENLLNSSFLVRSI